MKLRGRGRWAGLLAAALVIGGSWLAGAAMVQANGNGNKDKNGEGHTPVTLCHWVPAHGGSYITITVDDDGSSGNKNLQGHAGHENDIIPAPAEGCPAAAANTATPVATNTEAAAATSTPTQSGAATSTPSATATTGGGGASVATSTPVANTPAATETTGAGPTSTATPAGEVSAAEAGPISLPNTGTGPSGGRNYRAIALAVLAVLTVVILGAAGAEIRSRGTHR